MFNTSDAFILLVGDDGALLLPPSNGPNHVSLYAGNYDEDELQIILKEIAASPRTPLILLADTQAQHIRHEELPAVGFFDRRKLAHKRLETTFPTIDYKSCLIQKRSVISIGIESSGAFQTWLERIEGLPNPKDIACSLPVESAGILSQLLPQASEGWAMLLSIHTTGGTRQIVTKDGEILFTRITPPVSRSSSAGYIAAAYALEIKTTRAYLARFGLDAETPLPLVAIVPPDIQETMKVTPLDVSERKILTPHEAALALHLPFAPAPTEELAEIIHALWLANNGQMKAPLIKGNRKLDSTTMMLRRIGAMLAVLIALMALMRLGVLIIDPLQTHKHSLSLEKETRLVQEQLAQSRALFAPETQPLGQLRKAAERQRLFAQEQPPLFSLLDSIGKEIVPLGRITHLDWAADTLTLTLQPASMTLSPNETLAKLRSLLPNATITLTRGEEDAGTNLVLSNKKAKRNPAEAEWQLTIKKEARP